MMLFYAVSFTFFCLKLQATIFYLLIVAFLSIFAERKIIFTLFLKVNAYLGGAAALIGIYFPWTRDNNCRHY
ncbi:hypothetical protein [Providencia sp. PROV215]|uniref:hypothetical protein n=1 Tax=Providencia sp. PROV215 TaxID=2949911 RepID=UPI00234BBAD7|nr:hypothetical protein [Providencia sp. PROV215]